MLKVVGLFFILFIGVGAMAQFDTNYVYLTKDKFSLYPLAESAVSTFFYDYYDANNNVTSIEYHTRQYNSIGIGASFYRFGFSLTFELPYTNIPELKEHNAFNFKGGYSYRRFFAELRIKKYSGVEETIEYPGNNGAVVNIRKDITITEYGGNMYFFLCKKFNFDANYKNYNLQKKSAISPFINVGIGNYSINGDFLLSDSSSQINQTIMTEIGSLSLHIIPSFAATVVYRGFYFANMLGLGIGLNKNTIKYNDQNKYLYGVMPVFEWNSTIGYSTKSYFVSLILSMESNRAKYNNSYLGTVYTLWSIKLGKKINIKYLGKIGPYL
ncbi:MAG: hypothetical protein DRI86_00015 [Bacteroidetes bacterium]|nr:MAG: hypothetical protein DRI86_00015 [Bacteroidota bacterium]